MPLIRCLRDFGQNMMLVEKDPAQLVLKNVLYRILLRLHGKVNPVSIRKLHQPAVMIFILREILRKFIRELHIQYLSKLCIPFFSLVDKRCYVLHNKYNIIVLKDILHGIPVCP